MAYTADLMLAALQAHYSSTDSLGDLTARLRADGNFPTGFNTATERAWYTTMLDDHGVAYDSSLHLGDLANIFWGIASPLNLTRDLITLAGLDILTLSGTHLTII